MQVLTSRLPSTVASIPVWSVVCDILVAVSFFGAMICVDRLIALKATHEMTVHSAVDLQERL